jgi:hypothetical protein
MAQLSKYLPCSTEIGSTCRGMIGVCISQQVTLIRQGSASAKAQTKIHNASPSPRRKMTLQTGLIARIRHPGTYQNVAFLCSRLRDKHGPTRSIKPLNPFHGDSVRDRPGCPTAQPGKAIASFMGWAVIGEIAQRSP